MVSEVEPKAGLFIWIINQKKIKAFESFIPSFLKFVGRLRQADFKHLQKNCYCLPTTYGHTQRVWHYISFLPKGRISEDVASRNVRDESPNHWGRFKTHCLEIPPLAGLSL